MPSSAGGGATLTATRPSLAGLAERSRAFEEADPSEIVAWAAETFGAGLVLAASFENAVLIDIVSRVAPATEVVFLDTQYHFAETLWFAEQLRRRYDLNLSIERPAPHVVPDDLWQRDVEACCRARKVEPLARALEGRSAWLTGLRRLDAPTRANAPIVSFDLQRGVVKINPLANWTERDMATYAHLHDLPSHPLAERGYASVGCWPCTRPVSPGEERRAGRWSGTAKVECGLHA